MSARAHDRSTSLTGHPLRKRKRLLQSKRRILEEDLEDGSQNDEYTIKEEMILVKGDFDLLTGADEQTIRQELKDLFKVKFPLMAN